MRERNPETVEVLRRFRQIHQLPFAGEEKLPAPEEADEEEDRRTQRVPDRDQPAVEFFEKCDHVVREAGGPLGQGIFFATDETQTEKSWT